jgi:sulfonate transport system permease protein
MTRRLGNLALETWLPVALVVSWWVTSADSTSIFFPPLSEIVQVFRDTWLFERVGVDLVPSLLRFLQGLVIGSLLGIGLGLVLGMWTLGRRSLMPSIDFARSIPGTALVSVWIVLFGFDNLMKVVAISFITLFPVLLNTIDGVRGVDPSQLDMAKAYRIGRRHQIVRIILPAASPQIFTGLRIGLAVALLMMAFSEMFAGTDGIGFFIYFAQQTFRIPDMWTGIVLLGILGYLVNLVFVLIERRVLRWHRGWRATAREAGGT